MMLTRIVCTLGKFGLGSDDDGLDAVGDLLWRVFGIVGADEEDSHFGMQPGEVHMVEPPEDILGRVGEDAKIESVSHGVSFVPDGLARPEPAVGDRIADENDVARLALDRRHARLECFPRPGLANVADVHCGLCRIFASGERSWRCRRLRAEHQRPEEKNGVGGERPDFHGEI